MWRSFTSNEPIKGVRSLDVDNMTVADVYKLLEDHGKLSRSTLRLLQQMIEKWDYMTSICKISCMQFAGKHDCMQSSILKFKKELQIYQYLFLNLAKLYF